MGDLDRPHRRSNPPSREGFGGGIVPIGQRTLYRGWKPGREALAASVEHPRLHVQPAQRWGGRDRAAHGRITGWSDPRCSVPETIPDTVCVLCSGGVNADGWWSWIGRYMPMWPRGEAAVCKTVYRGSSPRVGSTDRAGCPVP